jgi:hypothetical protein
LKRKDFIFEKEIITIQSDKINFVIKTKTLKQFPPSE